MASSARRVLNKVQRAVVGNRPDGCGADRGTQIALSLAWKQHPKLDLRDVEFRNHSQNGEDGILLYLFTLAGHGGRRAVELCSGDGIESNTANLVLHHDWDALMLDGDAKSIANGVSFFSQHQETYRIGPALATEWITVENVNGILGKHGYASDLDLLSLDMDGVDYWILEALTVRPRMIVVEYNNRIPADRAVTVPYKSDFSTGDPFAGDGFFGASLSAFDKLLGGRGYRLVGANRQNTNAFFLREDVLPERISVSVESCLASRWAIHQRQRWDDSLAGKPWVAV